MNNFKDFGISPEIKNFVGDKISTNKILDKEITVIDYKIVDSKFEGKGSRLDLQIKYKDELRVIFTSAKYLIQMISKIPKDKLPFLTKIIEIDEHLEFS